MKKKKRIKQTKPIKHISEKIYVGRNFNYIKGVYPYKKSLGLDSVYFEALKETLKDSFFRILIWIITDAILLWVIYLLMSVLTPLAMALIFLTIVANVISFICNGICFKGRFIEKISIPMYKIIQCVNGRSVAISEEYKAQRKTGENYKQCRNDYEMLDRMSQIIDTDSLREAKLQVLLCVQDQFSVNWEYETDTVLLNDATSFSIQWEYLNKINHVDEGSLGPVSRRVLKK